MRGKRCGCDKRSCAHFVSLLFLGIRQTVVCSSHHRFQIYEVMSKSEIDAYDAVLNPAEVKKFLLLHTITFIAPAAVHLAAVRSQLRRLAVQRLDNFI